MKPQVLLTGATGFVGRQILRELLKQGYSVSVVCREPAKLAALCDRQQLSRVYTSIDCFKEPVAWWQNVCEGVSIVIHAAWYAEPGRYLQSPKNLNCLLGSLALAHGAIAAGVKHFIGIGTCFEYDLQYGDLSIQTPLKPISPYANAKVATFKALTHLFKSHQISFAWCRLFYLYGEDEDELRFVPYLRGKLQAGEPAALTSGTQIRDFLDVAKAGEMIVQVVRDNHQGAINICSSRAITVRQFAEQIADEYGRRDLLLFGARPDNLIDPPKVVGIL